jgi:truncated hemoglobin YjbI
VDIDHQHVVGRSQGAAHGEFKLTAEEFAEVAAEIVRALDFYNVPEREQQELVAAYQASMSDVVAAAAKASTTT